MGQILQHITSAGSAVSSHIDVGGNGGTNIDLRNLGSNRVLVLVNGKRWITGLSGSVNLDQIPAAVIDNIQVLKDGASSIYGSDAIAGVVNITTKKNFQGADASAYVGAYNDGSVFDGITQQYSIMLGYGGDKGNIVFGAQYDENKSIDNCARAISCDVTYKTSRGSSFGPQGRYQFFPPTDSPLYGNTALCPPNASGKPYCDVTVIPGAMGNSISDYKHWNNNTDQYNFGKLYQLMAPNRSTNFYVQGSYAFTDNVSFHSTMMYNHHENVMRYSPVNLSVGSGGGSVASLISASNPYNPFGIDLNANLSAPAPGAAQLVLAALRPIAGGFRNFQSTTNTFYYNNGVDGAFTAANRDFIWNVDFTYARELESDLTLGGEFNTQRLGLALGPASNCGAGTPNPDCVPLSFFGSEMLTPAMVGYVGTAEQAQTNQQLRDYQANLSTASLFDLPAGGLGASVGYEFRKLGGADHPDSLQQSGISTDGVATATSGGYTVKSIYGEVEVPLLANLPLVHKFDLDLAARHSQFSTFGSATTKQGGIRWQPTDELLVRGTVAQGYRAPNISELFAGQSTTGPFALDPCNEDQLATESPQTLANCRAAGVIPGYQQAVNGELNGIVTVGGNPHVQPETSLSRTFGVVYNPKFLEGFNVNLDFFHITVNNLIANFGAQNILDACYISGIQRYCDDISRNSVGTLLNLQDIETNVGNIVTDGYDLGTSYTFGTSVGTFKADLQATYTKKYDQILPSVTGGAPVVQHLKGWELGNNYTGYPKLKAIWSLNWSLNNWTAFWRTRYISGMIEDCTGFTQYNVCDSMTPAHLSYNGSGDLIPIHHVRATTYQDLSVTRTFKPWNTSVTAGINNFMNRQPAISYSAHNENFDPTIYDLPGRYFYLRVTTKF